MTRPKQYLLDSSVLINAARTYYAFDLAPKFWNLLEEQSQQEFIMSIDRVQAELARGHDSLSDWAETNQSIFQSTKENQVLTNYGSLQQWANNVSQYSAPALSEFARADNADPWLIAYAMQNNCILVTFESQFSQDVKKRIPIPNVCKAFDVSFCDLFQMMRELKMIIS